MCWLSPYLILLPCIPGRGPPRKERDRVRSVPMRPPVSRNVLPLRSTISRSCSTTATTKPAYQHTNHVIALVLSFDRIVGHRFNNRQVSSSGLRYKPRHRVSNAAVPVEEDTHLFDCAPCGCNHALHIKVRGQLHQQLSTAPALLGDVAQEGPQHGYQEGTTTQSLSISQSQTRSKAAATLAWCLS